MSTAMETSYTLRPHERFVRVAVELVEQLRAEPSQPVTVQIEERDGGELFLIFTRHDCPDAAAPSTAPRPGTR